ncbi:SixA phosphatase family protein [Congregibacter litoralis]|uniref:Phosphohistidine phosphatase SixA n=1 Tax=Congregibacter litoralis KT71 TaxID=314285 RepID=A4A6P6_9GAMM|nr:histidine phosphatase family protein [Congregibacter litoralis]EAQ98693.1 Phosphohistidine phosphatase SixA [Congregibacter litoralis KT71]
MKVLHLMRHAKSSWQAAGLSDHERELNERGFRDAPRMGQALAKFVSPQPIHCSSATRARQTLAGLCDGWPAMAVQQHEVDDALYTFDCQDLMIWLQGYQGDGESCFLLGHNPGLTDFCNQLVGRRAIDNLPTAGYLQLDIPVGHWSDVTDGIAVLTEWQFPRGLP